MSSWWSDCNVPGGGGGGGEVERWRCTVPGLISPGSPAARTVEAAGQLGSQPEPTGHWTAINYLECQKCWG